MGVGKLPVMRKPRPRSPLTRSDNARARRRFGATPRTLALPVLPYDEYGTAAWVIERRAMVGASELAAVLGVSPHASPFSLWWAKTLGWGTEQSFGMMIGHELEPVIARVFGATRPDLLLCRANGSLWRHPEVAWLGCSPDYLAVVEDVESPTPADPRGYGPPTVHIEPVECKSDEGGKGWGVPGTDQVPLHHRVQLIQQCAVFGAPRGHLVRMAGKRFSAYVVEYDHEAQRTMMGWMVEGQRFVDSLDGGEPPDVDEHRATGDALRELYASTVEDENDPASRVIVPAALRERYDRTLAETKVAEAAERGVKNELRAALGSARWGLDDEGNLWCERRQGKRAGYTVGPTPTDGLYRLGRRP